MKLPIFRFTIPSYARGTKKHACSMRRLLFPNDQIIVQIPALPLGEAAKNDSLSISAQKAKEINRVTRLPCIDVEALLREVSSDDRSPRKLATSKGLDSALCRLDVLVLDVDFSDAQTGAGTSGARDFGFDDGTVLLALFFDVFFDFCYVISIESQMSCSTRDGTYLRIPHR